MTSKTLLLFAFFFSNTALATTYIVDQLQPTKKRVLVKTDELPQVGDALYKETPLGRCQLLVTDVYITHFYADASQCAPEDLRVGTLIQKEVEVIRQPTEMAGIYGEDLEEEMLWDEEDNSGRLEATWIPEDLYREYLAERLAITFAYSLSRSLQGTLNVNENTTITDLEGANTFAFGADYIFARLPQRWSFSGGFTFELPRSYGRINYSQGGPQTSGLSGNPTLTVFNMYANLRYDIQPDATVYFGLNRLFASLSNFTGDTEGDFGFHFGGRYHFQPQFFAEASLNFYNLDSNIPNVGTTDLNLNSLELKAGYLF